MDTPFIKPSLTIILNRHFTGSLCASSSVNGPRDEIALFSPSRYSFQDSVVLSPQAMQRKRAVAVCHALNTQLQFPVESKSKNLSLAREGH